MTIEAHTTTPNHGSVTGADVVPANVTAEVLGALVAAGASAETIATAKLQLARGLAFGLEKQGIDADDTVTPALRDLAQRIDNIAHLVAAQTPTEQPIRHYPWCDTSRCLDSYYDDGTRTVAHLGQPYALPSPLPEQIPQNLMPKFYLACDEGYEDAPAVQLTIGDEGASLDAAHVDGLLAGIDEFRARLLQARTDMAQEVRP